MSDAHDPYFLENGQRVRICDTFAADTEDQLRQLPSEYVAPYNISARQAGAEGIFIGSDSVPVAGVRIRVCFIFHESGVIGAYRPNEITPKD